MDVFMFQAALYCPDCTRTVLIEQLGGDAALATVPEGERDSVTTADLLRSILIANGIDPNRESNWDSDKFPKGPYPDGGGEADSPQHCDTCHCFLHNPLTGDGYKYVLDAAREPPTCKLTADNMHTADDCTMHEHEANPVVEEWLAYYGDDSFGDGDDTRSINERLTDEGVVSIDDDADEPAPAHV